MSLYSRLRYSSPSLGHIEEYVIVDLVMPALILKVDQNVQSPARIETFQG